MRHRPPFALPCIGPALFAAELPVAGSVDTLAPDRCRQPPPSRLYKRKRFFLLLWHAPPCTAAKQREATQSRGADGNTRIALNRATADKPGIVLAR